MGGPVLGLVGWPADVLAAIAVAVLATIAVHVPCSLAGSIVGGRHVAAAPQVVAVAYCAGGASGWCCVAGPGWCCGAGAGGGSGGGAGAAIGA